MKQLAFIFCLSLTILPSLVFAEQCPTIRESRSFNINQKFLTVGTDFVVLVSDQPIGEVVQRIFNWGKTFELLNENGELIAKAQQRVFSLGVKVDVYDCQDRFIGSVQENIMESLLKFHTVYSILDAQNQLVGQSKKLDWFGTDITFYDGSNRRIATLSRPLINWFTDKWVLSVDASGRLDSRIMFFAAAYKTSADGERRRSSNNK